MEAQVAVTMPLAESTLSSFVTSGNVSMGGGNSACGRRAYAPLP